MHPNRIKHRQVPVTLEEMENIQTAATFQGDFWSNLSSTATSIAGSAVVVINSYPLSWGNQPVSASKGQYCPLLAPNSHKVEENDSS